MPRIIIIGSNGCDIVKAIKSRLSSDRYIFANDSADEIKDFNVQGVTRDIGYLIAGNELRESRGKGARRERKLARGW